MLNQNLTRPMETDKIQDQLISEFEILSDDRKRFKYFRQLIKIAEDMVGKQPLDDSFLMPVRKRQIWLKATLENGKVFFTAYSPSPIYKALLGILVKVFSGRRPLEIINCNLYLLSEIKLDKQLNTEWLNDLLAVVQRMKFLAASLKTYTLA